MSSHDEQPPLVLMSFQKYLVAMDGIYEGAMAAPGVSAAIDRIQ